MNRAERDMVERVTAEYSSPSLAVAEFRLAQARAKSKSAYEALENAEEALFEAERALVLECIDIEESEAELSRRQAIQNKLADLGVWLPTGA